MPENVKLCMLNLLVVFGSLAISLGAYALLWYVATRLYRLLA